MTGYHRPVLLAESVEGLAVKPDGIYVDVTFGSGQSSRAILERLGPEGRLFSFDQDQDAEANRIDDPRCTFIAANFKHIRNYLQFHGVSQVDGILADLGVSSHQFDVAERGFSTRFDGPLDMRMDPSQGMTAAELVQKGSEEDLTNIFRTLGEEPNARRIAKAILCARKRRSVETTLQLAEIVEKSVGRHGAHHPATRVFQALRMAVNDELGELSRALSGGLGRLKAGGRFVVITFESLTDRAVKRFFVSHAGRMVSLHQGGARWEGDLPRVRLVTRRAARPSTGEMERNPRSRSARLRVAEKV